MSRPRKHRSNLPPCVYLKHGAFFYVKGGKWQRIGVNLAEALAAYAAIVEAPKGGMVGLIDSVLAEITPTLARSTVEQYGVAARKLKKILAEFSPEQVKSRHIAGIKDAMRDTPNMANRCISFLRVVFGKALERQLVDSNPCYGVKRHVEQKRDRYIGDDELQQIYLIAGERLKVIIGLLYYTGQRIEDVLSLKRSDLNDVGIDFEPQKTKRKTQAKITVKWTSPLREVVERAKALGPKGAAAIALVPGRAGKPADYRTVSLQWSEACKAAGVVDAHIHDIRAKSLTDADSEGLNATALAAHSSPAMTQRYIRRRKAKVVDGPNIRQALDA